MDALSREMQKVVKQQSENMTGLTVKHINVTIAGIQVGEIS